MGIKSAPKLVKNRESNPMPGTKIKTSALNIRPNFQPIIDLFSQAVIGYEILSHAEEPYLMPLDMFRLARAEGRLWELECACRAAALSKISTLPPEYRSCSFFLNVSPQIFSDERFMKGFTLGFLEEAGIDQKQIVIEITEEVSSIDPYQMEALVHHYASQGFKIAMDDFGSGHSSLVALIAVSPHFLKLDNMVVRDIHKQPYRQQLVKSIVTFAASTGSKVIAEGVESWDELEVLLRLGVRFIQGFLVARPAPTPPQVSSDFRKKALKMCRAINYPKIGTEETISNLVIRPRTVEMSTMTCEEMDKLFKSQQQVDHVVIVADGMPRALITRQHFYLETGGPFGYSVFQKKPVESIAKRDPLVVEDGISVTNLAKLAMDRMPADIYDPVMVTGADGMLLGSITVKQLLTRASELEIRTAMGANPLTNLPGNREIQKWLEELLGLEDFTVVYADLDNFKEYNDAYGFLMGDEMIRFTSDVLKENIQNLSPEARLGHVGGDDFVIVMPTPVEWEGLLKLCGEFDTRKGYLFRNQDKNRGYYVSVNRTGGTVEVPLVTMSLAVVRKQNFGTEHHPALLGQVAASLKKKVKKISKASGRSLFLAERRVHQKSIY